MQIVLNGKSEQVPDSSTVKSLLEARGINPNVVACELNERIIRRAELVATLLKDGDQLEIIQMIGGG